MLRSAIVGLTAVLGVCVLCSVAHAAPSVSGSVHVGRSASAYWPQAGDDPSTAPTVAIGLLDTRDVGIETPPLSVEHQALRGVDVVIVDPRAIFCEGDETNSTLIVGRSFSGFAAGSPQISPLLARARASTDVLLTETEAQYPNCFVDHSGDPTYVDVGTFPVHVTVDLVRQSPPFGAVVPFDTGDLPCPSGPIAVESDAINAGVGASAVATGSVTGALPDLPDLSHLGQTRGGIEVGANLFAHVDACL